MKFPHLFSEGRIGTLRTKNRFVMPPMVRNYADGNGRVTPRYLAHIERIARGGVGLMILEASYVSQDGKGFVNQLGIHEDGTIAGLKKLAAAGHAHGAKIGVQLYHGGRQASSTTTGTQPVAPSAIPDPVVNEVPAELSKKDIALIVKRFSAAAVRAKKAGMDFVEIHGAHGYLVTQFLSPFSNKRTDEYGGTPAKRLRFLKEVYIAVRKAVGAKFPVTLRLSGDEYVPEGLQLKDTVQIVKVMEKLGIAAIHVSAGNYASYAKGVLIPPMAKKDGLLVALAAGVKKAAKTPVIAVAKIRTPEMAEKILAEGKADFVAVGRMLLADPDYPKKVQEGRLAEVNGCIACNQGCIGRLFAQQDVWCTVNPETGREEAFGVKPKFRRRVLVIGGGPAGMSAAVTAAERGHEVTLYEKEPQLGGQLKIAGILPFREDWLALRDRLIARIARLGVTTHLGTEFTTDMAVGRKYDIAVIAMGSEAIRPNLPGIGRNNVVISRDLLEGRADAKGRVVVVGGGCAGAQTAEALAGRGHPVTVIEATGDIAVDAPIDDRMLLLGRLEKLKVRILRNTKLMSIGPKAVTIEHPGGTVPMPADTVVICLGSFPNDGVLKELERHVHHVKVVGDALKPRRVTEAVAEGALAIIEAEK